VKEEGENQDKNYWTGWWAWDTASLKKKLNIEKHETIWRYGPARGLRT